MSEIINKVAQSGIVTIDPAEFFVPENIVSLDIAPVLWQGLVLKEKEFRSFISDNDWSQYAGKDVAVFCSADAIIPTWAFMLVASALNPIAHSVVYGIESELISQLIIKRLKEINPDDFRDKRVVIKGCSDFELSPSVYMELTNLLLPVVKSLMFGEPCSTVPVFKRK